MFQPRPSPHAKKYNNTPIIQQSTLENLNLPKEIAETIAKSINHSLASKTKGTYKTAMNMLLKCRETFPNNFNIPLGEREILLFIGWNINRGLKASSIKSYLSGIKALHRAWGWGEIVTDTPFISSVLKGETNINIEEQSLNPSPHKRLPVTIQILKLIKQEIRLGNLDPFDKIMYWGVCSLLFYGALRSAEILCDSEMTFDPISDLLKCDMNIVRIANRDGFDEVLQIKIRRGKCNKSGTPEIVDIYPTGNDTCPLRAFKKVQEITANNSNALPLFRTKNGKNLSKSNLNKLLSDITSPYIKNGVISAHSFRAGLISMFAGEGLSEEDLRAVGRWSSRAFEFYIKLDRTNRAQIARLIAEYDT